MGGGGSNGGDVMGKLCPETTENHKPHSKGGHIKLGGKQKHSQNWKLARASDRGGNNVSAHGHSFAGQSGARKDQSGASKGQSGARKV